MFTKFLFTVLLSAVSVISFAQSAPGGKTLQGHGEDMHANGDMQPGSNDEGSFFIMPQSDKKISEKIRTEQQRLGASQNRDMVLAALATTGIGFVVSGITDLVQKGTSAIVSSFSGHKKEWEQENRKTTSVRDTIKMHTQISNFYSKCSTEGALDPTGLQFNGVQLEKKMHGKTILRLVCSLDTTKAALDRIIGASKFSLRIDTLEMNVNECGLPCQKWKREGKFYDICDNVSSTISLVFTSSWITPSINIMQDVNLGSFNVTVPGLTKKDVRDGVYRYYRNGVNEYKDGQMMKIPTISGECFVVPRSMIGMKDENGYTDMYGLGEYKIHAYMVTKCENSKEFMENWKTDWKKYKEFKKSQKNKDGNENQFSLKKWAVEYFNNNKQKWISGTVTAPVTASQSYLKQLIEGNSAQGGMSGGDMSQQDNSAQGVTPQAGQTGGGMPM